MNPKAILAKLPFTEPFLFVDGLEEISAERIKGHYTFSGNSFFYQGHFTGYPLTPGVILTECMAQIGLVCLGIFLLGDKYSQELRFGLTGTDIDFFVPVYPGEKVEVISEKIFFRFQKLKCKVQMFNEAGKLVARGEIDGMIGRNE